MTAVRVQCLAMNGAIAFAIHGVDARGRLWGKLTLKRMVRRRTGELPPLDEHLKSQVRLVSPEPKVERNLGTTGTDKDLAFQYRFYPPEPKADPDLLKEPTQHVVLDSKCFRIIDVHQKIHNISACKVSVGSIRRNRELTRIH